MPKAILTGQNALIVVVANDRSIAWGCTEAMHLAGAEIAMNYLNDEPDTVFELAAPKNGTLWRRREPRRLRSSNGTD